MAAACVPEPLHQDDLSADVEQFLRRGSGDRPRTPPALDRNRARRGASGCTSGRRRRATAEKADTDWPPAPPGGLAARRPGKRSRSLRCRARGFLLRTLASRRRTLHRSRRAPRRRTLAVRRRQNIQARGGLASLHSRRNSPGSAIALAPEIGDSSAPGCGQNRWSNSATWWRDAGARRVRRRQTPTAIRAASRGKPEIQVLDVRRLVDFVHCVPAPRSFGAS